MPSASTDAEPSQPTKSYHRDTGSNHNILQHSDPVSEYFTLLLKDRHNPPGCVESGDRIFCTMTGYLLRTLSTLGTRSDDIRDIEEVKFKFICALYKQAQTGRDVVSTLTELIVLQSIRSVWSPP